MSARVVIANAFSLNMVDVVDGVDLKVSRLNVEFIREIIANSKGKYESIVGHVDTAALLSAELGVDVPCNRATFVLDHDATLIVGQYKGPRLAEGTKTLPEGAKIEWLAVWME